MARVKVQVPVEETAQQEQTTPDVESVIHQPELASEVINSKRRFLTQQIIAGAVILLVLILLGMLLNDRKQLKDQVNKLATNQRATVPQNDAEKYQEEIGKIVDTPTGLIPSLIPVKDAKSLAADNPFFKNAQDGDVVLLYVLPDKSVRAILYRPSVKKVIEATSSATIGASVTSSKQ